MRRVAAAALVAVVSSLVHAPAVALGDSSSAGPSLLLQRQAALVDGETRDVLWLAATDGSSLRPWLMGATPEWSPAGDAIAFSAPGVQGVDDVFLLPIEGRRRVNLTSSPSAETSPSWSPDGQKLAVATASGISVVDLTGARQTLADTDGGADPSWSPDGAEIAFVRAVGATRQVHIAAADGRGTRQVTSDDVDHSSPAWSPDGTRIAFTGSGPGGTDLYLFDIASAETTRVTSSAGAELLPRWTADGTRLYFVHRDGETSRAASLDVPSGVITTLDVGNIDAVVPQPCSESCPSTAFDVARSEDLRVRIDKSRRTLRVLGSIDGVDIGGSVLVKVEHRTRGGFESVGRAWTGISEGRFSTTFPRPFSGPCRVTVVFPGAMGVMPDRAARSFDCYYSPPGAKPGDLELVTGTSPVSGPGPVRRFKIRVERRTRFDPQRFADEVEDILYDPRSWGGGGHLGMKKVDSGRAAFTIILATPDTVDRLCAPAPTNGESSCFNVTVAVINLKRWLHGSETYKSLRKYRRYLINHEVGHGLDHRHRSCVEGGPQPVMMQQTGSLQGCGRAWWPAEWERDLTPGARV